MDINEFVADLNEYLEMPENTQESLSMQAEVAQSQISEWKRGKIKRMSKNAFTVDDIIRKYRKSEKVPIPDVIQNAVRKVWSGHIADAAAIANVIESLQLFRKSDF